MKQFVSHEWKIDHHLVRANNQNSCMLFPHYTIFVVLMLGIEVSLKGKKKCNIFTSYLQVKGGYQ